MSDKRDVWSGRVGFILATTGSAVGIGSIWKFPYEVGANGGSVFVLFYVAGLVFIVVPLMFAEFAIGRRGRGDPATSLAAVAAAHGSSRRWALAGVLGVVTGFLILSFYAVIGGWTIGYAAQTAFNGLPGADPQAVQARYDAFLGAPWRMLGYHVLFMATATVIVARGVSRGIEAASKVLMPVLVVLMIGLAAYSVATGDLAATLRFLLQPDPQHLTARAALEALGLGFFSIGVGLGLMITYAAYGGPDINLTEVAIVSVIADTAISFLAGFTVFPVVFAYGLDPASGPGLVFVTLPLAFAQMPFGTIARDDVLRSAVCRRAGLCDIHARGCGGASDAPLRMGPHLRERARGGDLLPGGDRHGAVVQPLVRLASPGGLGWVRAGHGLRPP